MVCAYNGPMRGFFLHSDDPLLVPEHAIAAVGVLRVFTSQTRPWIGGCRLELGSARGLIIMAAKVFASMGLPCSLKRLRYQDQERGKGASGGREGGREASISCIAGRTGVPWHL